MARNNNNKLEEFVERWGGVPQLNQIAVALDKAEDYEDSFEGYWRDFLGFVQTKHEHIDPALIRAISSGNPRQRLDAAKTYFTNYRKSCLNYSRENLEDIVDEIGKKDKLSSVTLSAIPIKDYDMEKSYDLNKLIDDYEDSVKILRDGLKDINPETEGERYEIQKRTVEEYEEYRDLLKDYKPLVENILSHNQLVSYAVGERGKPNNEKMQEVLFEYLEGILEKYKNDKDKYDDNAPVVETIKALSGNPRYLMQYYTEGVLKPAEEKFKNEAGKHDLKDYVERNIKVMNTNRQIEFFSNVYAIAKENEMKEAEEGLADRRHKLYGFSRSKAA